MTLTKEKIEETAFDMFREWTLNAKKDLPHLDFTIVDERKLVEDVSNTIFKSNTAIHIYEKTENRKQVGFDKGFICGFICGNINTKWYNEYVIKQSNKYKEFIVFKSLKIHLELFEVERIKINNIYKHLFFEDLNIYQNTVVENENLQHISLKELDIMPKDEILVAINNQINNYINEYLNLKTPDFLESVVKYFSDNAIIAIIANNIEK